MTASEPHHLNLIVVEDSELDYELLVAMLMREGLKPRTTRVEDEAGMREAFARGRVDAVITDHNLPRCDSFAPLKVAKSVDADIPVIVLSGEMSEELAVATLHAGADDFVLKTRMFRIAAALQLSLRAAASRNIVTAFDAGEDRGNIYIAMEFVEGKPLDHLISEKRFDFQEVLDIGIQVAEALDYAHQKGVVHRDIKPSNMIMDPEGHVKITDFGIAHIEDVSATLQTMAGEVLGTPAYMSPEQVLGKSVDGRSDLFSLGIILYEMATGERPFGIANKNIATA